MTFQPYARTRTERKQLAQQVRNMLGTSRDGAQSTRSTIVAAWKMSALVEDATAGDLRLALVDRNGNMITWGDAINRASPDPTL